MKTAFRPRHLLMTALLAATGRSVKVLERHYEIGGCAHEFHVDPRLPRGLGEADHGPRRDESVLLRGENQRRRCVTMEMGVGADGAHPLRQRVR